VTSVFTALGQPSPIGYFGTKIMKNKHRSGGIQGNNTRRKEKTSFKSIHPDEIKPNVLIFHFFPFSLQNQFNP
jgi:hypothetical protein